MAEELGNVQSLVDELADERRKGEGLEQKVNELLAVTEAAERGASIRAELQKLGVAKIDLAFRAVKDDLQKSGADEMREYLSKFVAENPELMPARMAGGSGASAGQRSGSGGGIDMDKIRPGMSAEDMERVRQEIARVASQALRGGF